MGIRINPAETEHKDKASLTGWELYTLTGTEDYHAELNLDREKDVDKLMEVINQSKVHFGVKKIKKESCYALVVTFSPQLVT